MGLRIWTSLFILLFFNQSLFASNYKCEDVKIQSLVVQNESEKRMTCFHSKKDSYFISENCFEKSCELINKLKITKFDYSSSERPGKIQCKTLGGIIEYVNVENKGENIRCIFTSDLTFISLNMLESWDGKKFTGPKLSEED